MKITSWLAFSIDRNSRAPVFEQICEAIRSKAVAGELAQGTKLPPTRAFATELGVSRSTVVTAYEQLVAEGYLQSVQGSGFLVCAMGEVELKLERSTLRSTQDEEPVPEPQPFQVGTPDMRLFPYPQWARAVSRVCRSNPEAMLLGGSNFGNPHLRKAIAAHVSEWRGIDASPHQIIVTAGSTDALEVCTRTLANFGDRIGLENPGYQPLRQFAQAQGLVATYMEIDEQGAILPRQRKSVELAVLTPSHQFPLGGAMSPNRRMEFIRWAEENGSWIIEDDYDSEFRYAGRPIPAMAGFDHLSRTIYVGSFSKIFSNSLRLGYLIVPENMLEKFKATMSRFGPRASYMPQQALAEFISNGEFYRHLRRMRRVYAERRNLLIDRLTKDFASVGTFVDHQAGMQIVLHLNAGWVDLEVASEAAKLGLATAPLSGFCDGETTLNGLILGYCGSSTGEIENGLIKLRRALS